jgi:hypothetical protein
MSKIPTGYFESPNYDQNWLGDTVGYVTRILVEQEGTRDQLRFYLKVYYGGDWERTYMFNIWLDHGTTVAFAQLQLLRDALDSLARSKEQDPLMVRVHFSWGDETYTWGYAYALYLIPSMPYPTKAPTFYGDPTMGSCTHVE